MEENETDSQASILDFFPKPSYRKGQKEALLEIDEHFLAGKRVVILEGPTGTGKSAIGVAVSRKYGGYLMTSQKTLQEQYEQDFRDIAVLRGRNYYTCGVVDGYADAAPCVEHKRRARVSCMLLPNGDRKEQGKPVHCAYAAALDRATVAPVTLFNYHGFYAHRRSTLPREDGQHAADPEAELIPRFPQRGVCVLDETHNLEGIALDMIQVTLEDTYLPLVPETTVEGLILKLMPKAPYRAQLVTRAQEMSVELKTMPAGPQKTKLFRDRTRLQGLIEKIAFVCGLYRQTLATDYEGPSFEEQWLMNQETAVGQLSPHKITMKPVFGGPFVPMMFLRRGQRLLLMSATILNKEVFCRSIGVKPEHAAFVSLPCHFPVENRLVHVYPCGDLSYKNYQRDIGRVLQGVRRVLEIHKGQRGILHTHSWKVSKAIEENIRDRRLIFQRSGARDRSDFIEMLKDSVDGVLVAPAMHEGLDLRDDWSRFQAIVKVPWPDLSDPQIKARCTVDEQWYTWVAALKLVQAAGRSVRSETDWAATYILDAGFANFYNRCLVREEGSRKKKNLLPTWFTDSLRLYSDDEADTFLNGSSDPCSE